jgi:ParB/RepB/Spo0J family partition protein
VEDSVTTNPVKYQTPIIDNIKLSTIKVDPRQNARTVVDEDAIKELATSMKREGQLQPVRVEMVNPGTYVQGSGVPLSLVFGYRRIAAAELLKWDTIRAEVVETMEPADRAVANLLENLGRENLTTYDQATAFHHLQKDYTLSGTNIAHSVGKSVPYVNNLIRISEGLDSTVLERWKQECSPSFGRDPETGKRLPNVHMVCTSEWLGKLVARVPRAEQERELKIQLGLITDDDGDDDDGGDGGDGTGSSKPDTDAPRRATMKQLERALAAAEAKVKESKGEEQNVARAVVSTLKYAMGKNQGIKPIGWTNPKPGEEPAKEEKSKETPKKK